MLAVHRYTDFESPVFPIASANNFGGSKRTINVSNYSQTVSNPFSDKNVSTQHRNHNRKIRISFLSTLDSYKVSVNFGSIRKYTRKSVKCLDCVCESVGDSISLICGCATTVLALLLLFAKCSLIHQRRICVHCASKFNNICDMWIIVLCLFNSSSPLDAAIQNPCIRIYTYRCTWKGQQFATKQ